MFPIIIVYHFLTLSKKISEDIEQVLRDRDDAKRGGKRSIFYELRDSPTLPSTEKSSIRLEHEGTLLVMAGIERSPIPRRSCLSNMCARNRVDGKIHGNHSFPSAIKSHDDGQTPSRARHSA